MSLKCRHWAPKAWFCGGLPEDSVERAPRSCLTGGEGAGDIYPPTPVSYWLKAISDGGAPPLGPSLCTRQAHSHGQTTANSLRIPDIQSVAFCVGR